MIRHQKKWFAAAAALLLGATIVGPTLQTQAATPKRYLATATSSLIGGVASDATLTVKNTTQSSGTGLTIGAARIVVPQGLTVTSGVLTPHYFDASGVEVPFTFTAPTYSASTRTIEFLNLNVVQGEAFSVTLNVSTCAAGSYQWGTDIRQSNDFNGTLNKFKADTTDPSTTVSAANACRLAFVNQPANTFPTAVISTVAYGAAGGSPITVAAQDGTGATITTFNTPITAGFSGGDATATLSNAATGLTVTPVAGVATFSSLSLNKASSTAYRLTAAGGGLSASSNTFVVSYKAVIGCVDTNACQTPQPVPGPGTGSSASVGVNGYVGNGELTLDWNSSEPAPDCAGYVEMPNPIAFNLTGSFTATTKTINITEPIPAGTVGKSLDWQHQICFRSPMRFPGFEMADLLQIISTADGSTPGVFSTHYATQVVDDLDDTKDRWQGLLFDCDLVGPTDACIVSRHVDVAPSATTVGSVSFVLRVPAGDPWAR